MCELPHHKHTHLHAPHLGDARRLLPALGHHLPTFKPAPCAPAQCKLGTRALNNRHKVSPRAGLTLTDWGCCDHHGPAMPKLPCFVAQLCRLHSPAMTEGVPVTTHTRLQQGIITHKLCDTTQAAAMTHRMRCRLLYGVS